MSESPPLTPFILASTNPSGIASQVENPEQFSITSLVDQASCFRDEADNLVPYTDPDDIEENMRALAVENRPYEDDGDINTLLDLEALEIDDNEDPPSYSEDLKLSKSIYIPILTDFSMELTHTEVQHQLNAALVENRAGYSIVIGKSRRYHEKVVSVDFICNCGGSYRNWRGLTPDNRLRPGTSTRKTSCPFLIRMKRGVDNWNLRVIDNQHNHMLSENPSVHPVQRLSFLSDEVRRDIMKLFEANITPRNVHTALFKKYGSVPITRRDLYNLKALIINEQLTGRSPIQALIDEVKKDDSDVIYRWKKDEFDRITHLMVLHRKSLQIYSDNSDVLALDCTYKTNKYGMPMLTILGPTKLHTTLVFGFAFMKSEKEEDYEWALSSLCEIFQQENVAIPGVFVTDRELALIRAIDNVFPASYRILCLWHVNMNVRAHAKKYFRVGLNNDNTMPGEKLQEFMTAWKALIESATPEIFDKNWIAFKSQPHELVDYCRTTWIEQFYKNIVWAWVDSIPHFGHRVASRAEGAHSRLKQHIQISTGDLYAVYRRLMTFFDLQVNDWEHRLAASKASRPTACLASYWESLIGYVTTFALNRMAVTLAQARGDEDCKSSCTASSGCQYQYAWGLPCKHYFKSLMHLKKDCQGPSQVVKYEPISLSKIHPHWLFDRTRSCYSYGNRTDVPEASEFHALEPAVVEKRRGRPAAHKKGHGKTSTRRNAILEERVDKSARQSMHVTGVIRAQRDNQHTVYTSGAGSVIGSGSAPPPNIDIGVNLASSRKRAISTTSESLNTRENSSEFESTRSYFDRASTALRSTFYNVINGPPSQPVAILGSRHTQSQEGVNIEALEPLDMLQYGDETEDEA